MKEEERKSQQLYEEEVKLQQQIDKLQSGELEVEVSSVCCATCLNKISFMLLDQNEAHGSLVRSVARPPAAASVSRLRSAH